MAAVEARARREADYWVQAQEWTLGKVTPYDPGMDDLDMDDLDVANPDYMDDLDVATHVDRLIKWSWRQFKKSLYYIDRLIKWSWRQFKKILYYIDRLIKWSWRQFKKIL